MVYGVEKKKTKISPAGHIYVQLHDPGRKNVINGSQTLPKQRRLHLLMLSSTVKFTVWIIRNLSVLRPYQAEDTQGFMHLGILGCSYILPIFYPSEFNKN